MSALIGQPPNTEEDYWIVKGILTRFGLPGDPALGIAVPPVRPPDAHFENRGPRIIATNSVVIVLVILITGSRVLVRALHRGLKWGWDDWVIILASTVIVTWFCLALGMVVRGGGGKHIWSLTYHEYLWFEIYGLSKSLLYLPGACLVKISITLFNRRITGLASRSWRIINNVFLGILGLYMIVYTIWLGTRCKTNSYSLVKLGKLTNPQKCDFLQGIRLSLGLGVAHVVLDFCLLCTPIIVLWKVKMERSRKIRPFIVFLVGSVSCVGAMMIPITQYQIHEDAPWNYLQLETWIILDLFFGVLVASLPILAGQLPKSWGLFKAYAHNHSHSQTQRTQTLPESAIGSDRTKIGIYHHPDLESKSNNFRLEGDDEIELLHQNTIKVPESSHHPNSAFVAMGDLDLGSKSEKELSRNESLGSNESGSRGERER